MFKIGEMYHLHFIRPCEPPSLRCFCLSDGLLIVKKYKGATPLPSLNPSRPSFETKEEMMKEMLRDSDSPPRNHTKAKRIVGHARTLQATNFLIQNNFQGPRPG